MDKHRIEVDEEVFEALQELATPLVDTPNSVLRRLLLEGQLREHAGSTISLRPRDEPDATHSPAAYAPLNLDVGSGGYVGVGSMDAEEPAGPYASLGDERRAARGMSPRRFGKILCAREFPGEIFERARRDRGSFRTMFESEERLLYFLNFNKPGATNLWYKVNTTALQALLEADKPAYVVFTNPADRLAWVVPIEDLARAYKERGGRALGAGDLDVNIDVEGDRVRELDWSVEGYRREV